MWHQWPWASCLSPPETCAPADFPPGRVGLTVRKRLSSPRVQTLQKHGVLSGHQRLIRPRQVTPLIHQYGEMMTASTREDGPSGPNQRSLDVLKKPRAQRSVEGTYLSGLLNSNMDVFLAPVWPLAPARTPP